jgi:hypothetical protein
VNYQFEVINYKPHKNGILLEIYIPENINYKLSKFEDNKQITGEIIIDDNRKISAKQKKLIYATIKDISNYIGYTFSETEQLMISEFNKLKGYNKDVIIGFSMSVASEFILHLIEFCFNFGIHLTDFALNRIDNLDAYLYLCLKFRVCCICGLPHSDIHHWDAIGRQNREKVDDSNLRKISLCRIHHSEYHQIGRERFMKKYKVKGILFNE